MPATLLAQADGASDALAPPPLRCGETLRCPHCRYAGNEEAFLRLPSGRPEFQPQTVPVWRCPACRRHFALRPEMRGA